jgi:hypothetical protein
MSKWTMRQECERIQYGVDNIERKLWNSEPRKGLERRR